AGTVLRHPPAVAEAVTGDREDTVARAREALLRGDWCGGGGQQHGRQDCDDAPTAHGRTFPPTPTHPTGRQATRTPVAPLGQHRRRLAPQGGTADQGCRRGLGGDPSSAPPLSSAP